MFAVNKIRQYEVTPALAERGFTCHNDGDKPKQELPTCKEESL